MTFDRLSHMRHLSSDPALRAKRDEALRARLCIRWTPEMDAALTELANARLGAVPIAAKVGVSKALVRQRRDQLGLPKGKAPGGSKSKRGTVTVRVL